METPRSVYVHVPFCRHRCGYCNFTLVAGRDYLIADYLKAIEIELDKIKIPIEVDTIYLGGGTPSRLPPQDLQHLLSLLANRFRLVADGEFTMEANPDDLPGEIESVIRDSDINRVSLGIQSFSQPKLRSLDRDHDLPQIELAIDSVKKIVDRFSIDLIFAAPHDSLSIWEKDLSYGIGTGATHISTYELTFEKGTIFWNRKQRNQIHAPTDDHCVAYYEMAIERLRDHEYAHYEVSSFAKSGQRSRHNQVYWIGSPYLAFGPGASGFMDGVRYTNHRAVKRYLTKVLNGHSAIEESRVLSRREMAIDQIVFGLRLIEGIDLRQFEQKTGYQLNNLVPTECLDDWTEANLVTLESDRLRLTSRGILFADTICSHISMLEPPGPEASSPSDPNHN
ncbi:MAG: radical SAM family heme chaperone HemW [Pirellulaceae bacterium]|nr:radical SAM family heme chaperone HemW [Pirellulaceae bacterium]